MADTRYARYVSIAVAATYPASVGTCALLKAATPLMANQSWSEIFYGPLITITSCLTLILIGHWIENFIRSRSGSGVDCERE